MELLTKFRGSAAAPHSIDSAHRKRSQLYVKRQFQQSMVLEILLLTFISLNLIVIASFWMMDSSYGLQREQIALVIACLEIAAFFFIYRYNLRASHRIAGPIFKIERCLKHLNEGDLAFTMRLREKDQFQELANQMNNTVASLRFRIARAQALTAQMQNNPDNREQLLRDLLEELEYFETDKPPMQDATK